MSPKKSPKNHDEPFPIQILDGGLGTTLQSLNPPPRFDAGLWSSTPLVLDPPVLSEVHTSYSNAGAGIISTATYQATLGAICWMDIHDAVDGIIDKARGEAIMRNAVTLARNAVDSKGDGLVALSLGPYGATMRPSTEYTACYDSHHSTQERLRKWHLDRLLIYASDPATWERIDCVAFETFGRTDEILAARKAMDDLVTIKGLPPKKFWISCVFVEIDGQVVLPSGETPKKALQSVLRPVMRDDNSVLPRPWGIGINCTKVGRVRGILKEWVQEIEGVVSGNVEWPTLVLYPDGTGEGERYDSVRREWVVEGQSKKEEGTWAERVAQLAREVKESEESGTARWAGVVVGGCCRIGPEDIKRLSHELLKKSS